ncbi:MAG: type IA DNA topoisomerase [Lachnospiraceae bacterium]|nr:type IA DNA topoisomerase [Lachnospiraceae bacterium]
MAKALFIAEKPSVAASFAEVLGEKLSSRDGYREGQNAIVTWCVGHLVGMSYPDKYDEKFKKWRFDTLPFLPEEYLYEVLPGTKKQFDIVCGLLNRDDVDRIYVCTDAGREGEYIYRLVRQMSGVSGKTEKRVWIDSQTEEEMKRGIREARDISEYDNLSTSAYLRAKEDYLMGINFSRVLALRYGKVMASFLNMDFCKVAVGRVMTCVLGMVVRREREIRNFEKTPFYRVFSRAADTGIAFEWKAVEGSKYYGTPYLYKENGFLEREKAKECIELMGGVVAEASSESKGQSATEGHSEGGEGSSVPATVLSVERKTEKKNAPLLYNLAEIQNDCSKLFKITPEQTLNHVQSLYEKKLVTYPRTDARVLSTAIAKEIDKNLRGVGQLSSMSEYAETILKNGWYKGIEKTKYVDDKKITDHYAIIPTGQGLSAIASLSDLEKKIYEIIVRRFLAIFYPQAVYGKIAVSVAIATEQLFATEKYLKEEGYLPVMQYTFTKKKNAGDAEASEDEEDGEEPVGNDHALAEIADSLKKGMTINMAEFFIKDGETSPPKRYTSGSMILAMENAGNLIEDEELREHIKGSGIGTSATRAGILDKLVKNDYMKINKKTQVITPTLMGEMIFDVVYFSIRGLLDPKLTASWEKGLTGVAEGTISEEEYMTKLSDYVSEKTNLVKRVQNADGLTRYFKAAAEYY